MRFLLIILLIQFKVTFSQPEWLLDGSFDVSTWEKPLTKEEKLSILREKSFSGFSRWFENAETTFEEQIELFHFGDFNGDEFLDILLIGYFGSEAKSSHLYLGTLDEFKSIVTVSDIDRVEKSQYDIPKIISHMPPCCADIIHTVSVYEPISNNAYSTPVRYYFTEGTVFPEVNEEEGSFEVINTPYHLRLSPLIDNEYRGKYEPVGNISNTYSVGAKGVTYHAKPDSTGRVWWFVKMTNPMPPDGKHFPEQGTFFLGWMSSRYLKKL